VNEVRHTASQGKTLRAFFQKHGRQHRAALVTLMLGSLLTLALCLVYTAHLPVVTALDLKIYDALLPLKRVESSGRVVIVDLNEASFAAYGQWPWPRYRLADLVDTLHDYQVAAIGLDMLFVEPDRTSPNEIQKALQRDKGITASFQNLPPESRDNDRLFAEALARVPATLAAFAQNDAPPSEPSSHFNVIERAAYDGLPSFDAGLPPFQSAIWPLPILEAAAPASFANVLADADGVVRSVPLLVKVGETVQPALALYTVMRALGKKSLTAYLDGNGLHTLKFDKLSVPVTPAAEFHIPFSGPHGAYPYISAKDVLQKRTSPEQLAGKIVFIGTSAVGLRDIRATPFDQVMPGVEIHAAIADALLTQNAIRIPFWSDQAQVSILLLCGLFATLVFGFARARVYLPTAFLVLAGTVGASCHLFTQGIFFSPLYGIVTMITVGGILLFPRLWQEERQKLAIRNTFSHYVAPEIVKHVLRSPDAVLAGEERVVSILFTDIREFTNLSERLTPHQTVHLLNRYFTPMTALVRESRGTVDKFIGDALMAFWNAPLNVPEHPRLAVMTALAMQERLTEMNAALVEDLGIRLAIGAGIHTGPVYVGNMGSQEMLSYTLIGDGVNLAARLETLCARYGVGLIVSESTRDACEALSSPLHFQYLDTIRVKGKQNSTRIYAPMLSETATARHEELLLWDTAIHAYLAADFAKAGTGFQKLHETFAKPLYALFADRAALLQREPPPDWDGVWNWKGK